jgi:hypothetical protein
MIYGAMVAAVLATIVTILTVKAVGRIARVAYFVVFMIYFVVFLTPYPFVKIACGVRNSDLINELAAISSSALSSNE